MNHRTWWQERQVQRTFFLGFEENWIHSYPLLLSSAYLLNKPFLETKTWHLWEVFSAVFFAADYKSCTVPVCLPWEVIDVDVQQLREAFFRFTDTNIMLVELLFFFLSWTWCSLPARCWLVAGWRRVSLVRSAVAASIRVPGGGG